MLKAHEKFLQLLNSKVRTKLDHSLTELSSMLLLPLAPKLWQEAATVAAELSYRFVGIWAQDLYKNFEVNICLELNGAYLLLRTLIKASNPTIASFTPYFPAANRLERHTHDMFGVIFADHPDTRRWTRHQAWSEKQFPLRKNFNVTSTPANTTPPDNTYPFTRISGAGTYEVPVGPVHAGIIEPGHFRFQVAGEDVINLEERLGYVHRGIEKIAEGRNIKELNKIAGRVSGDSTVVHTWAACKAIENALNLKVPERAIHIRAIMCEHERIANHLGDIAAICNDVAYTFAYYQLMRLKELWLRLNAQVFGHRLIMDCIIPGGVCIDLNPKNSQAILKQTANFKKELVGLYPIFEKSSSLHGRVKTTGILSVEQATKLGALGFVGRASNHKFDLRHDAPYPPYDKLKITVPVFNTGDVLARLRVRMQETLIALELVEGLLSQLPSGPIFKKWSIPHASAEGIGLIEGWRGEVLAFVKIGNDGLIERYFPRDPSWFSWPALEQLVHGNIVPDFPVCNKSINGSYAAVDL